jgi:hypothetical protein
LLRHISDNEFQEAACIATKLKHYKSAVKVGELHCKYEERDSGRAVQDGKRRD